MGRRIGTSATTFAVLALALLIGEMEGRAARPQPGIASILATVEQLGEGWTSNRVVVLDSNLLKAQKASATGSQDTEHHTYLRGILNVPGFEAALLEILHTLAKPTNAPPVVIATSRLVRAGQHFEDDIIKDAHFQFEVIELDLERETVKTREAGVERVYTLPTPPRSASAKRWIHLQNAAFMEVMDLYAGLEKRVLLLHPSIADSPISLEAVWTSESPSTTEIAGALRHYLEQKGISVVADGSKFLQLIPTTLNLPVTLRSKGLPTEPVEIGGGVLNTRDLGEVTRMYAAFSGRQCIRTDPLTGGSFYLRMTQPMSKPEMLYALETLLKWQDGQIILGEDKTFSVVRIDDISIERPAVNSKREK